MESRFQRQRAQGTGNVAVGKHNRDASVGGYPGGWVGECTKLILQQHACNAQLSLGQVLGHKHVAIFG